MLVVTAGHIDHGKTALVRALTGVETDRLPEEKARGISIDLGFAYWRPEGLADPVGFIDVPGHERFVRTMLAGAGGASFALLVIAADDGIMPQTVEHARILGLLGLERGALVLTKCDRADEARRAEVRAAGLTLLAEAGLPGLAVFEVSARTGEGIAALASALAREAGRDAPPPHGGFRLAVDRAFSVSGAGCVVTGTVSGGALAVGETLVLSPQGRRARVRGLQSAGRAVERVRAGQRCAVNLAGIETGEVHRGDWLLDPAHHAPTCRFEAQVRLLPSAARGLRHGAALHLHLGTADLPARLLLRGRGGLETGGSAQAAIVTERPLSAINGQRFVLRDASGRELLGGGRVLDPFPPKRRKRGDPREEVLAALATHDAAACLAALLAIPGYEVPTGWFALCFNLLPGELEALCELADAQIAGRGEEMLLPAGRLEQVRAEIPATLGAHHRAHPEVGGMPARELAGALPQSLSQPVLAWLLRRMADDGEIALSGALVRLPGHSASYSPAEAALWRQMLDWIEAGPPRTVTPAELAAAIGTTEGAARAMLFRRRTGGDLWAIDETRFMLREHVAMLAASAAWLARENPAGFTAAQFRDATGIGRNHVIRLLEFLDRIGVTARRGDGRVVRGDYENVVGAAAPWLAGAGR